MPAKKVEKAHVIRASPEAKVNMCPREWPVLSKRASTLTRLSKVRAVCMAIWEAGNRQTF